MPKRLRAYPKTIMKMRLLLCIAITSAFFSFTGRASIGLTPEELISEYGTPVDTHEDEIFHHCTDYEFWIRSKADDARIAVTATVLNGVCQEMSYIKVGTAFDPQEIRTWMLEYSQKAGAKWKIKTDKNPHSLQEWTLEKASNVPYTYQASWIDPNVFAVNTKELITDSVTEGALKIGKYSNTSIAPGAQPLKTSYDFKADGTVVWTDAVGNHEQGTYSVENGVVVTATFPSRSDKTVTFIRKGDSVLGKNDTYTLDTKSDESGPPKTQEQAP